MNRLLWMLLAAVLLLGAYYVHLHRSRDAIVYVMVGVGAGIGCAVAGSFLRQALVSGTRRHG
jgi:hypothetical protein